MNLRALTAPLRPLGLWAPIGLPDPQALIDVRFRAGRTECDVTGNQVVLSLAPLHVGIGDVATRQLRGEVAELQFCDRVSGVELGVLRLEEHGAINAAGVRVTRFRVTRAAHRCLPAPLRTWQSWMQRRRADTSSPFHMSHAALEQLAVFYICPRPVVLVSAQDGECSNLFPMDLIGPVAGPRFVLALRNTSPSVAILQNSRRAALADVALGERSLAYALGKHHRESNIDWSALPCQAARSSHFGLRVPAHALRVREFEILAAEPHGSHTVFVCRLVSDEGGADAPRLFHTSGIHGAWRRRHGAVPWHEPSP